MLASSDHSDAYTPEQLFAGDTPIETIPAVLASGQNLAQHAVVARITASGLLTQWNPAGADGSQIAIGVLVHACDATGANTDTQMYRSGCFNIDKLVWPGGATTIQKVRAFDGSAIAVRALPGSTTVL